MAHLTLEQQKAIAIAQARQRQAAAQETAPGQRTREQRLARIEELEVERTALAEDQPSFVREVVGGTLADIRGLPETALQLATGAAAQIPAGLAGIATAIAPVRGVRTDVAGKAQRAVEAVQEKLTFEPRTEVGQRVAEAIAAPLESVEQFADIAGEVTGDPEDVLGATAVKTAILGAPALLGLRTGPRGAITRAAEGQVQRGGAAVERAVEQIKKQEVKPPTVEELFKEGSAAFRRADEAGVKIKPESSRPFGENLAVRLADEGIDPVLHPKSTQALKRIAEDTEGGLSFKQVETLRRIAKDAASAIERPDRRFGRIIIDEIDDYIARLDGSQATGNVNLAQRSITAARDFWGRARKGELLEGLVDRAGIRSGQFSGSGFENALRTEFRGLALNEKRMRGFTRAERALIERVAAGGPVANALRFVGKFAPRGIISTALSIGGGQFLGGPLGAILLPVVGEVGRAAATRATLGAATRAAELARAGPQ